jgi:tetratricopeptide (TPR) repeat protein
VSEPRGRLAADLGRGLAVLALAAVVACAPDEPRPAGGAPQGPPAAEDAASAGHAVPEIDTEGMEPQVAARFAEVRREVLANPSSAAAWGRLGMAAHAHEIWDAARIAYRHAGDLDRFDERWPYYLGDVLSVAGTDLEAAAEAFERTLALRPGYAPAHMRLGRVLGELGRTEQAAAQFERAIERAPELAPARLGLAQMRIAQGELAEAEELLERILASEPRHGQALSALGQVFMRQGRREEARAIAERARDSALYNLFSDPLMDQVVQQEASSVLLWERAKAFFERGDWEQAARGLEIVARLKPSDPEVHHQLGVAYAQLGRLAEARPHFEQAVALDGTRVVPRVQLARLHLEEDRPAEAVRLLERVLELDPSEPEAGWLLGRARIAGGDVEAGLAALEAAARAAGAAGGEPPSWVHTDWAGALAQVGRPQEALDHLRIAVAADPRDARALFYTGLIQEGLGRIEPAMEAYCRSLEAQPGSPAAGRLRALDRSCPPG